MPPLFRFALVNDQPPGKLARDAPAVAEVHLDVSDEQEIVPVHAGRVDLDQAVSAPTHHLPRVVSRLADFYTPTHTHRDKYY